MKVKVGHGLLCDDPVIQPKTKGAGIMVSDYVEEHDGFLRLSGTEAALAKASDPTFPMTAQTLLEYGGNKEGYWNSEKFMKNVEDAARIVKW